MRIRIVGAGAVGINVLDEWILLSDSAEGSLACDGEASSVEASLASEKLLLGPDLVGGLGCFGSRDLAWRLVGQENQRLDGVLRDCSRLLIVTGLAGATGATVAESLSLKSVEREIPTTIFAFSPFPFEAEERQEAAAVTRDRFPAEASVVVFPAPAILVGSSPDVASVRRELRDLQGGVARLVDIWSGMANGSVFPTDQGSGAESSPFAAVGNIEDCRVFWEAGTGLDDSLLAFLQKSAFRQAAEKVDRCLAYIEASEEVSGWQEDVEAKLRQHLPDGAHISLFLRREVRAAPKQLLLLLGQAAPRLPKRALAESVRAEPTAAAAVVPTASRVAAEPEERPVPVSSECAPFTKTATTFYKGENLDVPAFRRRNANRPARE